MSIDSIENNIDVTSITHDGISVWPVLKSYLIGITGEFDIIKEPTSSNIRILLKGLVPDIFSLGKLRKQRYWVFTNSERRYYINETSFDRITTGLLNYLDSYCLFENPIPKGRTKKAKLLPGEQYIGMSVIFLLQYLLSKVTPTPEIKNIGILEGYLKMDLSRMQQIYRRILAGEKVYDLLIRIWKPKAIFVVCYYSNFELIRAAKRNHVPVVELQHGLVTENHRAYYFSQNQPDVFMPDYFLSYGIYSSEIIERGRLLPGQRILNYGYSFLEAVNKRLSMSPELREIRGKFKTTICITGQLEVTDVPLLEMIGSITDLFPEICFIFKPRFLKGGPSFKASGNFIRLEHLNTYELLKYCDYHLTVYSTCALECLALGTPNIAIDIGGFYTKFLSKMLDGNPFNYSTDSREGLIGILRNLGDHPEDDSSVKNSIAPIFSPLAARSTFQTFLKGVL